MERSRAWRRFQTRKFGQNTGARPLAFKPEKNWKLIYTRSDKLVRAKQLGLDYPIRTTRQLLDREGVLTLRHPHDDARRS